ncbi:glycosyltransferase [Candidatus Saccharibacteria bacterium]|nr:glycosyltransferase [Candidatus Saccharibacteria bacterium]
MKVALVCDWLTNVGGAEKVLLEMHKLFPKAPIYTSKYSPKGIDWFKDAEVKTGWLQIFPVFMRRILGPLRQSYFSHLDLSDYDLIISVTGAEAKAVKSGKWLHEKGVKNVKCPNGLHISFCHVPTQYYWEMYDTYVKNPGFGILNPVVRVCFKALVKPLRKADLKAAKRPDYYITISEYAKEQIQKYYDREATVIHPPVEIAEFRRQLSNISRGRGRSGPSSRAERPSYLDPIGSSAGRRFNTKNKFFVFSAPSAIGRDLRKPLDIIAQLPSDYYIITSRQVNWKRIDLAIKACLKLGRKLLVVGEGPEHKKLVKMAGNSDLIEFVPLVEKSELAGLLAGAKGYLFPSKEPFGIAPVEALAAGCPVIAYGEGGALDYVSEGKNGVLFEKQTVKSLVNAIERFEKLNFDREKISKTAEGFETERFDREIKEFVNEKTK